MKVKRPHTKNVHKQVPAIGDLRKTVPEKQAAALGFLALAYNETEAVIDRLFFMATGLVDELQFEVSTRIPIDGKLTIIKIGAKPFLEKADWNRLTNALGDGGFGLLKFYRDGVVHARHLNAAVSVGVKVDKQAKIFDFLIAKDALEAAYEIAIALRKELNEAASLVHGLKVLKIIGADDPKKAPLEAEMKACQARFRNCQIERLALPPIPEFPEESELLQADFLLLKAQQLPPMGWVHQQDDDFQAMYHRRAMSPALMDQSPGMPFPLMMEELEKQKKR
jgi:hypothetical protein